MFKLTNSNKDNQWYFTLKAGNHEIILQSEGYTTRAMAIKGMVSIMVNAVKLYAKKLIGGKWFEVVEDTTEIIEEAPKKVRKSRKNP
jgi:uncharacterized protein YegP (UPF0339 family)